LTLDGFKFIYHMEWGHRNWGRGIGVAFMLPLIYFLARGRLSPQSKKRCLGLMGLLGFQGGLGWYMVKSGLGLVENNYLSHAKIKRYSKMNQFNLTREKSRSLRTSTCIALQTLRSFGNCFCFYCIYVVDCP